MNIEQLLNDMIYLSPIQVYKKHGVGIQTQERIKESVVKTLWKMYPGIAVFCARRS